MQHSQENKFLFWILRKIHPYISNCRCKGSQNSARKMWHIWLSSEWKVKFSLGIEITDNQATLIDKFCITILSCHLCVRIWNQIFHTEPSDLNNSHCKSSVPHISLLIAEKNSERRNGYRGRMLHQAVVLHNTKRENYSWHSTCLCSFSVCVIIAESFEHSMHLT